MLKTIRQHWKISLPAAILLLGIAGFLAVSRWPQLGAEGAMLLRPIIGEAAVTRLEQIYLRTQDEVKQRQYQMGLATAEAPWAIGAAPTATATPSPTASPTAPPTATATMSPPETPDPTTSPSPTATAAALPSPTTTLPTPTPTVTPTPSPTPWRPAPAASLGSIAGEGEWAPYIFTPEGTAVAYRTFLQPDPERPYALAGVVAFDLTQTRLHYQLGSAEPDSPDNDWNGSGRIPNAAKQPGFLLATFNGGFLSTHGTWGAMQDGLEILPPRDGFMTIAIFDDGQVQMGEWGRDLTSQETMVAWRQNGRPVVQDGELHDRIFNNSVADWGAALGGDIITWRSGIALSGDGRTLYYIAGPSLSMPALGRAMQAAGADQGMLLDINQYWAHFAAIRAEDGNLVAEPLFADGMEQRVNRYLFLSDRDFFYVTLAKN